MPAITPPKTPAKTPAKKPAEKPAKLPAKKPAKVPDKLKYILPYKLPDKLPDLPILLNDMPTKLSDKPGGRAKKKLSIWTPCPSTWVTSDLKEFDDLKFIHLTYADMYGRVRYKMCNKYNLASRLRRGADLHISGLHSLP